MKTRKISKNAKRTIALFMCMTLIFTLSAQSLAFGARSRRTGKGSIISEEEAVGYACGDIGVETEEAEVLTTEVVYEEGQYAYKICLAAGGIKYFYSIRVFDGAVLKSSSYTITYKNKASD